MQRNGIVIKFIEDIFEKISSKNYERKSVNKEDLIKIEQIKPEIEKLINIYTKYLYILKTNGWDFDTIGVDLNSVKMPDDIKEDLWQVQKQFNFNFQMPIPADLGEYYGQVFERKGKMVPGLTLMYRNLIGKEVNWHQVLIYKENELTPKQRYEMSQAEKLKVFEQVRQEEIMNNLQIKITDYILTICYFLLIIILFIITEI